MYFFWHRASAWKGVDGESLWLHSTQTSERHSGWQQQKRCTLLAEIVRCGLDWSESFGSVQSFPGPSLLDIAASNNQWTVVESILKIRSMQSIQSNTTDKSHGRGHGHSHSHSHSHSLDREIMRMDSTENIAHDEPAATSAAAAALGVSSGQLLPFLSGAIDYREPTHFYLHAALVCSRTSIVGNLRDEYLLASRSMEVCTAT